jgi:Tol biopolymer transport system component
MARRTLYLPALIVAAVLMACAGALLLAVSSEGEATSPGKNGRIAYASGDPSDQSEPYFGPIYTITPGGGGRSKVANGLAPSYSPDGKRIAYYTLYKGNAGSDIYTINVGGEGKFRVTHTKKKEGSDPSWGSRP